MLIQSARPRLRPPGNAVLRARRGHPLTHEIRALILTGGVYGLGIDLVTGAQFTGTNSPSIGMSPEGPAVDYTGTAFTSAPKQDGWNVVGHVTVAWRGLVRNGESHGLIVANAPAGGNGAAQTPFSLEVTNAGMRSLMWVRSAGSFEIGMFRSPDNVVPDGLPFGVSISAPPEKTTAPVMWVSGVPVTVSSHFVTAAGPPTANSDPLLMGRRGDGDGQLNGRTAILLVAAQEWSAAQHALWHLDPYGVLEEAPLWFWVSAPVASSGITGTAAATLGALTSAGAATLAIAGTAAKTLGAVTASGAATVAIAGSGAKTLAALTAAGAGAVAITATGAKTLGTLAATGAATLGIAGQGAITLGALGGAAGAVQPITGAQGGTLGALQASGAGSVGITGAGAATLGALTCSASAGGGIVASGAVTLGALAGAGAAAIAVAGAAAGSLGALSGAGAVALAIQASGAVSLAALTGQGAATISDEPPPEPVPAPAYRTVRALLRARAAVARAEDRTITAPYRTRTISAEE